MKCIFIGGADRSGTTMLASMLSNIKGAVVTPESLFKTEIPFEYPISTEAYSQQLIKNKRFKRWETDISALQNKNYLSYDELYQDILALYSPDKEIQYWIDHSPNNLMHGKLLNSTFKDCFFIHIVRDGRAVAHSQIPLEWGENTFLFSAKAWLNKILYGFIIQSLFPEKTLLVKYEDLLLNSEKEIQRILMALGQPQRESTKLSNDFVPSFSKEQHSLVGKAPDIERMDAWRSKLSNQDITDFQYYASHALQVLGYEIIENEQITVTKKHMFKEFIKEMWFKKIINPTQYKLKRK